MTHFPLFPKPKEYYFRSMESVVLDRGTVYLLEDHIRVEGDDAVKRKRRNFLIYGGLLILFLAYIFTSYRQYRADPHSFDMFLSVIKVLLFLILLTPGAINRVVRFSTTNEIPYSSIKKFEPAGTWSKWNQAVNLYLQNNEIRTLWFKKEEMARFSYFLTRKLNNGNA